MRKIQLRDGTFPGSLSATLAGDNAGQHPAFFEWDRNGGGDASPTFYTDMCLVQALEDKPETKKIAWLIEPPEINSHSYQFCVENETLFDYILTHIEEYAKLSDRWLFYPFGGSWIRMEKWGVWTKNKDVSLIASEKRLTDGHKLRHEVADTFCDTVDVLGRGYVPIESKMTGLIPYRYSIVIENVKRNWWFTEKLIDAFSVATVPIYWGVPGIGKFFDMQGMLCFNNLRELGKILAMIGEDDYNTRLPALERNMEAAVRFHCVEDWLWLNYPFLFNSV